MALRQLLALPLLVALCACCAGQDKLPDTGTSGPPPARALAWDRPKPVAPTLTPLGARPWTTALPSRDAASLVRATPDQIVRQRFPAGEPMWTTTVDRGAQMLAWSEDGTQLGALTHTGDGEWLAILNAETGAVLHQVMLEGLKTPPIERGIQPPASPTGFYGAAGGGFHIQNAYGTYAVDTRSTAPKSVSRAPQYGRPSLDGGALYHPAKLGLARVGADPIDLGCYPQWFAVHEQFGVIAARCVAPKDKRGLRLFDLQTGAERHAWKRDATPLGMLSPTQVLVQTSGPHRVGIASTDSNKIQWLSGSASFRHLSASPSGDRVAGWGAGGFQVVDVQSGKLLCDDLRAGAAIAVGLVDDKTAWLVTYLPDVFNALALRKLDIATCVAQEPVPLGIGKTTNLLPQWLPEARSFVLLALYGAKQAEYGLVTVPVDSPGTYKALGGKSTPTFAASADGSRIATWTSDSAAVLTVDRQSVAQWNGALGVAMCDGHEVRGSIEGWSVWANGAEVRKFGGPQPDAVTCHGQRLYVARSGALYAADISDGVWSAVTTRARVSVKTKRGIVIPAGPTGWSILDWP